jgi:UDP-N-acetylglucosamine 1-carboxyvinyltransferase
VIADSVLINGGKPLIGQVSIQGAKNAALPILAATILFEDEVYLHNVPDLVDIRSMLEILRFLGAEYTFQYGTVHIKTKTVENKKVPLEISNKLRASSLIMGPMIARFGSTEVGMPGGCNIGPRPLNFHFSGLEALGSRVELESDKVDIKAVNGVSGEHELEFPSVGATENLIMASIFSPGTVTLKNVAKEPEIIDLVNFLNKSGAKIKFTDISTIEIEGVEKLHAIEYQVKPDRIEAGTFLMGAFATKGDVTLIGVDAEDLGFVIHKLKEMGANITVEGNTIRLQYKGEIKPVDIRTAIYPGFPTDLQPQMSILLTQANGSSTVVENIFENRLGHFDELKKMNAKVEVKDNQATINTSKLTGSTVDSFDLRGAAAMIIAGLCAAGTTRVEGMRHLHRGYEGFIQKLQHLGADIDYF